MSEHAGEKTEQPTQRRLEDAVKQGQIARSPEVQTVAVLLAGLAALLFTGQEMWQQMVGIMVGALGHLHDTSITRDSLQGYMLGGTLALGKIVGPILEGMPKFGAFRVMVLSDHPTPIALMTHGSEPSPFAVYSSRADENLAHGRFYGETAAREEGILISPGHLLMNYFIRDWSSLVHEESH